MNEPRQSEDVPHFCVIDDDESARASISSLLRAMGSGVEAFWSAESFLADGWVAQPDCLLLDVSMPGMDGLELQRRLKSRGSEVPIIFISGQTDQHVRERALSDGAVAFLQKPAGRVELMEAIGRALKKVRAGEILDAGRGDET